MDTKDLKEITYFTCLKIISESIAKCPIVVKRETEKGEVIAKEHKLFELLKLRPNENMTAIDCIKSFVARAKHEGISALYINRDKDSNVVGLYPVEITNIIIDNAGLLRSNKKNKILYEFKLDTQIGTCFEDDLIILKDLTLDGIYTKAVRKTLRQNLDTSIKSQTYLNTLFGAGLTNKLVVQMTSDIKEDSAIKKLQDRFDRLYRSNGRTFLVPAGYNVQALNLSLADAQYHQLRLLSKEEIAGAFGVPLTKLGFVKENAKSEEQDNLKFLTDTLLVIFEAIEQEMDYKLLSETERKQGYKIRFNINVLLRTDSQTQANIINAYVRNGVYDLDMAKGILGLEKLGGEPIITLPSGQVLLKDLLNGNTSYQKGYKTPKSIEKENKKDTLEEVKGGDENG
nr:phage portal protein [Clostridium frigidicarnis]